MKKKILVLLLVVLALTFVVQVAMTTHPQKAMAAKAPAGDDCYWVCDKPVYDAGCQPELPGCCRHWVLWCMHHPSAK